MQPDAMTPDTKNRKRGLGRGLAALFDDDGADSRTEQSSLSQDGEKGGTRQLGIDQLQPGKYQPRHNVDEDGIHDLAASIAAHGILQPLLVRPAGAGFEIIAGERRWRAAQRAGLHTIPVMIKNFDDNTVLQVALIENLQREDLNAVEEAIGYRRLMDEFGHSQEKLAAAMGKSRSHIANTLRLMTLPPIVLDEVKAGRLSAGHARALVTVDNPEALMRRIMDQGLSVRQTEKLAALHASAPGRSQRREKASKDIDTLALENEITARLGMAVAIDMQGKGGAVKITFKTLDQLDEILRLVSNTKLPSTAT